MLDTNICIHISQNQPPEITREFKKYRRGEIAISSITWAEMCCGTKKSGEFVIERLSKLWEIVPFCKKSAETYALLTMEHPNRKAGFDRLIAAHAIVLGVPLISNNASDFVLYKENGLILENWI